MFAASPRIRADEEEDPQELTEALNEITRRIHASTTSRWLSAAGEDGSMGARAWLLEHDGVAQVEDVATAPSERGRGLASAVVSAAIAAARRSGAELVFVVADADETTPELYRKLGFEPLAVTSRFIRRPPELSPG